MLLDISDKNCNVQTANKGYYKKGKRQSGRVCVPPIPIELPVAKLGKLGQYVEAGVKENVKPHQPHQMVRYLADPGTTSRAAITN